MTDDGVSSSVTRPAYHRRPMECCILAGDTEGGGLDMVMPVAGLMMGMALRPRVAAGWCSLWLVGGEMPGWKLAGGMKGGDDELREKPGGTVC